VVGSVRDEHGGEPVWNADRLAAGDVDVARVVACRREDLSNAMWAARRSGVWIAGVELTGLALVRAVPEPPDDYVVLLDASGPGAATVVLLDQGTAVRVWRVPLDRCGAAIGSLVRVALDTTTALQLAHADGVPLEWVASYPWEQAQPVDLVGPGSGLAPGSGVPLPSFAGALGLALAGVGVGAAPIDLQPSLLTTGVASLQAQLAGRTLDLRRSASPGEQPAPLPARPAPKPTSEPTPEPVPAAVEPDSSGPAGPEPVHVEAAAIVPVAPAPLAPRPLLPEPEPESPRPASSEPDQSEAVQDEPSGPETGEPGPTPAVAEVAADGDAAGPDAAGPDAPGTSESALLGALFPRKEEPARLFVGDLLPGAPGRATGDGSDGGPPSNGSALVPGAEPRPGPVTLRPVVIGDVDGVGGVGDTTGDRPASLPVATGATAPRRRRFRRLVVVLVVAAAVGAVAFFVVRTVTAGAAATEPVAAVGPASASSGDVPAHSG